MFVRLTLAALVAWSVLVHVSCYKRSSVHIKRIHNKSDKTLQFRFHGIFNVITYGDTITIYPGETKDILYYKEENKFSIRTRPCHIARDSVSTTVLEGGRLLKRLTHDKDWLFARRANNQICTFEVTNDDID